MESDLALAEFGGDISWNLLLESPLKGPRSTSWRRQKPRAWNPDFLVFEMAGR
jgi:hypothetical protein